MNKIWETTQNADSFNLKSFETKAKMFEFVLKDVHL
jgi:hypothetical protein